MITQEGEVAGKFTATPPAMLPALLHAMREAAPQPDNVLSAVLDVSPAHWERNVYMLKLRDGCKLIRPHLAEADRENFERAVARVEGFLAALAPTAYPGIALYAGSDSNYFFAASLPDRPSELVTWSAQPELEPLERMLDDSERVVIALVDQSHTRIFAVALGQLEVRQEFSDDVPRKQATGGWHGLAQPRMARHREWHVLRHIQRTIDALLALQRQQSFDRLLISGPDEAVAMLEHHLPRPLRLRLSGRLHLEHFASEADVLTKTLEVARQIERSEELATVRELIESNATPHVALGLEPVLAAVSENRVYRLLLADPLEIMASVCPACGRLTTEKQHCPVCESDLPAATDVREIVLDRAWRQGARISIVSGDAALALEPYGRWGAWVRH
jgi:hypothetical protein